jgi:BirA family transcriptional regulator, biotin operon repressor / biotin---[acetyl-CoA-carboxylase] ligase
LPDPRQHSTEGTTFDNQIIELDSVDSTNNYAMGLIHAGLASDGLICLARHQWAGKGQRGKTWTAERDQSLLMSLIIEPSFLKVSNQFLLSAATTLGITETIGQLVKEKWTIKWPNDIYWDDRKAAGILIENIIRGGNWSWAVVGIGVNLNQVTFSADIPNAVSLKQITGQSYEPRELARDLIAAIQGKIKTLKKDPEILLSEFNGLLYKKNQPVILEHNNERIITTIIKVDGNGILHTNHGAFDPGSVRYVN